MILSKRAVMKSMSLGANIRQHRSFVRLMIRNANRFWPEPLSADRSNTKRLPELYTAGAKVKENTTRDHGLPTTAPQLQSVSAKLAKSATSPLPLSHALTQNRGRNRHAGLIKPSCIRV